MLSQSFLQGQFAARKVLCLCYHGDTTRVATSVLRAKGFEAVSIEGGHAALLAIKSELNSLKITVPEFSQERDSILGEKSDTEAEKSDDEAERSGSEAGNGDVKPQQPIVDATKNADNTLAGSDAAIETSQTSVGELTVAVETISADAKTTDIEAEVETIETGLTRVAS